MMSVVMRKILFLLSLLSTTTVVTDAFSLLPPPRRRTSSSNRWSRSRSEGKKSSTALAANSTSATSMRIPYRTTPSLDILDHDSWRQRETLEAYLHQEQYASILMMPSNSTTIDGVSILSPGNTRSKKPDISFAAALENQEQRDIVFARILLLAAAALYGTNFSVVKILGDVMPVGISTTLRFGMAAIATVPWLFLPSKKSNNIPKDIQVGAAIAGLEVGLWNSVGYIAQAVGLETTEASKSAFLCSLAVVIVPILDYALSHKKLKLREWLGAVMAVCGVGFLELGGGGAGGLLSSWRFGDFCSLIQPLAFGIGFWRMETAMRKYPSQAGRSTAGQLMSVFLASLAYLLCTTTTADGDDIAAGATIYDLPSWAQTAMHDPMILAALFWTGVVTTALTVWMETLALKTLSAAETTLIFSTEPLWGTACACVLMGEHLGIGAAAGALLIVGGCIYSNLGIKGLQQMVPVMPAGAAPLRSQKDDIANGEGTAKSSTPVPTANSFSVLSALGTFLSTLQWGDAGDAAGNRVLWQQSEEVLETADETIQEVINSGMTDLL